MPRLHHAAARLTAIAHPGSDSIQHPVEFLFGGALTYQPNSPQRILHPAHNAAPPDSQLATVWLLLHPVGKNFLRLHIRMHVGVVLGHLVIGVLDALDVLAALYRLDDGDIGVIPDHFPQTMVRQQLMAHQFAGSLRALDSLSVEQQRFITRQIGGVNGLAIWYLGTNHAQHLIHFLLVGGHHDPSAGGSLVLSAPLLSNKLQLWLGHAASVRRRIGQREQRPVRLDHACNQFPGLASRADYIEQAIHSGITQALVLRIHLC